MNVFAVALMLIGTLGHFAVERYAGAGSDEVTQRRCQRAKKIFLIAALLGLAMGLYKELKSLSPHGWRGRFL